MGVDAARGEVVAEDAVEPDVARVGTRVDAIALGRHVDVDVAGVGGRGHERGPGR